MYINGIVLGVLATLFVEMAVIIFLMLEYYVSKEKEKERKQSARSRRAE